MKVKVLGTGSLYSKSNCAGILIDDDTLIDIGTGTVKQLIKEKHNLQGFKHLLISHLHLDHILDFPIFICNLIVCDQKQTIKIFGPKGTKKILKKLVETLDFDHEMMRFFNRYCEFYTIKDGSEGKLGHHSFKAYQVDHGTIEAYGFNIDHKLSFTGDSAICEGVRTLALDCQYILCDCSLAKGDYKHMGINDINQLALDNQNITIIPTHFRDETLEILSSHNPHHLPIISDGYHFEL